MTGSYIVTLSHSYIILTFIVTVIYVVTYILYVGLISYGTYMMSMISEK